MWDEVTYPSLNVNGYSVEVWEWISNFFLHFIMDVNNYSCWDVLAELTNGRGVLINIVYLGPLLLTWFNFNPSMDK